MNLQQIKNIIKEQRICLPFRDRMFWNLKTGYIQALYLQERGAQIVGVSFRRLLAPRGQGLLRANARVHSILY